MAPTWRFAEFELDPDNQVFRKHGQIVKLAPQPFKALLLLVTRSGELVTRDDLRRAIWQDGVHVDFEHGLNTCMRQVRAALGDEGDDRIIETVPRIGYRLKGPATRVPRGGRWSRRAAGVAAIAASVALLSGVTAYRARLTWTRTPNQSEADDLYVRGRLTLDRKTEADTAVARQLFAESAKRNPGSAQAQAGLALTYLTTPTALAGVAPATARALAADAVRHAAALDPSAFEVQLAAAQSKLAVGDWHGADLDFERIVRGAPSAAAGHQAYGVALSLQGRFDDALREGRRAEALDPLSASAKATVANTLRFARRYDEAIIVAQDALRLDPTYGPAFHTLGLCYEAEGQLDRAIDSYRRSGRPNGNLGHAYAVAGRTEEARQLLHDFEQRYRETGTGAGGIAQVYVGLGEYDHAFEWLQRMVDEGGQPTTLKVADVWDPLRADPRFPGLLVKLGLSE